MVTFDVIAFVAACQWYQKRACVCCGAALAGIQPAIMVPERHLMEWKDIPPEKIPQVLATAAPVCRACLNAETRTWFVPVIHCGQS